MSDNMSTISTIVEKATAGAYGVDSAAIGKMAGLFMAANFEQSWGPFICGTMGAAGPDGLHDGYLICPTYGADAQCTARFNRVANGETGPETP